MDKQTVAAYEGDDAAQRYVDRRSAYEPARAEELAASIEGWRADIGCGPGHYTTHLGEPLVSLDASHAMVNRLRERHPGAMCVQADFGAMPFRRGALAGAWASKTYQHVGHEALPMVLADLHRSTSVGARIAIDVFTGEGSERRPEEDDFPGRLFSWWDPERFRSVVQGAGFTVDALTVRDRNLELRATRALMLPDFVRPGLRVLFCGYNPSIYAAEHGVPFARPGNRFWPAALAAGIVTVDRDPWHAVAHQGIGFTDLVKRATVAAGELSRDELRAGLGRVGRLCEWLQPEVVCILGIGGWRQVVDRHAKVGWQPEPMVGARVYVMPNPSGLNASTQHEGFVQHLTRTVADHAEA